ncbi:MAG: ATP-binding protein [Selenomonadaceae bacterium]|nr:ATP-binding protein [Selenomonadaceae bacterium]
MEKFTIEATLENLPAVTEFITSSLEEKDCSIKIIMQMELVIEEIYVNVASYAYRPNIGTVTIYKSFEDTPPAITVTFVDSGTPYNPLEHEDPDINAGIDARQIGGLGIFLVKKNVDEISYERKDGQNILTFKKFF